jgi:hypothetical protein
VQHRDVVAARGLRARSSVSVTSSARMLMHSFQVRMARPYRWFVAATHIAIASQLD